MQSAFSHRFPPPFILYTFLPLPPFSALRKKQCFCTLSRVKNDGGGEKSRRTDRIVFKHWQRMMLTGAYEGFVVACHRHRDQAHGYCSRFRLGEGKERMSAFVCFCLEARERERERDVRFGVRKETYLFWPLLYRWSRIYIYSEWWATSFTLDYRSHHVTVIVIAASTPLVWLWYRYRSGNMCNYFTSSQTSQCQSRRAGIQGKNPDI